MKLSCLGKSSRTHFASSQPSSGVSFSCLPLTKSFPWVSALSLGFPHIVALKFRWDRSVWNTSHFGTQHTMGALGQRARSTFHCTAKPCKHRLHFSSCPITIVQLLERKGISEWKNSLCRWYTPLLNLQYTKGHFWHRTILSVSKGSYMKERDGLSSRACSDRKRGNCFKLKESLRFRLNIRKEYIILFIYFTQ